MTFIHENQDWPDLTCDTTALAAVLAAARHRQGLLIGKLNALGIAVQREADLTTLTAEVVASSAIEGERLPSEEVRSSIARRLGIEAAGLPEATRAVDGVVEMMLDATQRFEAPLTADRLHELHAALFPTGRAGGRRISVGAWRTDTAGPMQVVSGPLGSERVHFQAPAAERSPDEMQRFLEWVNEPTTLDPFMKAAFAHFWFVTIHPFDDGNGRIADQAERTLDRVFRDAWIWQRANSPGLNGRQRTVLLRLLGDSQGNLTTQKYALMAKTSHDTALRDITALVDRGVLARNPGGGRSVSFRFAEREPAS